MRKYVPLQGVVEDGAFSFLPLKICKVAQQNAEYGNGKFAGDSTEEKARGKFCPQSKQ
jgi:hypothetical protein